MAMRERFLAACIALCCFGQIQAADKKAAGSVSKNQPAPQSAPEAFEELNFNRTLVIEGKVEKPQVQFTLIKEPPPEKEIRFEASFLENILKLDRENTFRPGDIHGQE